MTTTSGAKVPCKPLAQLAVPQDRGKPCPTLQVILEPLLRQVLYRLPGAGCQDTGSFRHRSPQTAAAGASTWSGRDKITGVILLLPDHRIDALDPHPATTPLGKAQFFRQRQ